MTRTKVQLVRFGSAKHLTRSGIGVFLPEPNMIRRYDPA